MGKGILELFSSKMDCDPKKIGCSEICKILDQRFKTKQIVDMQLYIRTWMQ